MPSGSRSTSPFDPQYRRRHAREALVVNIFVFAFQRVISCKKIVTNVVLEQIDKELWHLL